ncbi:MAG: hypothetical protein JW941_04275, partial [Candidatus Coatesbacteria bacterium]|nr:hypothetical protein [Candidatus Coatesbacteria bacterium]
GGGGGTLILTTPAIEHDARGLRLPLGRGAKSWEEAEAHWGHVRPGYRVGEVISKCEQHGFRVSAVERYGGSIAQMLYQLWYLRDMSWLFSKKLVVPYLIMELALRLDETFYRNRGCAIALKATLNSA